MDADSDDDLVAEIMRTLEIDHQYECWFDANSEAQIAHARSCGRRAGRTLGYKVRTFSTDAAQHDEGKRVVFVVVIESTQEDDARIAERSQLLITDALNRALG